MGAVPLPVSENRLEHIGRARGIPIAVIFNTRSAGTTSTRSPTWLEPDQKAVRLSQILQFYTDDFLKKASSLIAYVNKHRQDKIPDGWKVRVHSL